MKEKSPESIKKAVAEFIVLTSIAEQPKKSAGENTHVSLHTK